MLISFQNSSYPHLLINTDHIISMSCQVRCHELQQDLPAFVNFYKEERDFFRGINKEGEELFGDQVNGVASLHRLYDKYHDRVYVSEADLNIHDGWLKIRRAGVHSDYREEHDEYRLVEYNIAECAIELELSGTGGAEHGSSSNTVCFHFWGLENFLAAIDAIKEQMGVRIVG